MVTFGNISQKTGRADNPCKKKEKGKENEKNKKNI